MQCSISWWLNLFRHILLDSGKKNPSLFLYQVLHYRIKKCISIFRKLFVQSTIYYYVIWDSKILNKTLRALGERYLADIKSLFGHQHPESECLFLVPLFHFQPTCLLIHILLDSNHDSVMWLFLTHVQDLIESLALHIRLP